MINKIEMNISKDVLKALLEIAKLLKCAYFYSINNGTKTIYFGLGPDMSILKKIEFLNSEPNIELPINYPIAIMEKDLAAIVKDLDTNNLTCATIIYFIGQNIVFPKYIYTGLNKELSRKECISFIDANYIYSYITKELDYYSKEYIDLSDNEQFNFILQSKAKDGLSYFNIENQTIQVMPSILGANKNDTVSIRLNPIYNNTELIEFKINKKSKHCDILVSYRIIPLIGKSKTFR